MWGKAKVGIDWGVPYRRQSSLIIQLFLLLDIAVVIKGWDESVIDMQIGEIAKIHCTPDYACK